MQTIKSSGNRAVVITEQNGKLWANLYVNAKNGIQNASITPTRWEGKTMAGALRWAEKQLAA